MVVDDGRLVGMVSLENINRYLLLQSSIKSPRRRPAMGVPPLVVTSQTPAPPPVISGVPPIVVPQSLRRICPTLGLGVSPNASKSWPFNSGSGLIASGGNSAALALRNS